jgi:hypothetical protein
VKSKTDSSDPRRLNPHTENEAPRVAILLKDRVDPRCKKSNTDMEEPNLPIPKSDTADPMRDMLLTDKVDPREV